MYLSKLEIIGFKSFASKVTITFDSGISSIVGPNGCGKSNVVDAIRWVLGEQRYSTLRSEKMEDVIFNGTKLRKALGMAEASLVIENTRGILPLEYSQVTVGRRVYRSGESEYLLNKVPCRLKDILDLFMDTGMGSDAYSVIELKMVETILSDKTDERRRLFEEASGVTKYKHRRKAAYRKLEAVQADLNRVNDIVAEVQKAVATLERQARKAEQYNEMRDRLRVLEIDAMEREYAQLTVRLLPLEERLATLRADAAHLDVDLVREEEHLDRLRTASLEEDRRVAEAQRDISLQMGKINRIEQRNMVAEERIRSLTESIARFEAEKGDLGDERVRLEASRERLTADIAAHDGEEALLAGDLARREQDLVDLDGRLASKKAESASLNDRTIDLVHRIAAQGTEVDRRRGRIEDLERRSREAAATVEGYEAEIVRIDAAIEALTAEDRQLRRAFAEREIRLMDAEEKKAAAQSALDAQRRRALDLRAEVDRRQAQADFLKGLIESGEGQSEGIRFLAGSPAWPRTRTGTVADAVHAAEEYRPAIEAALGEFAGLVIVEALGEAEEGVRLLRAEAKGKVSFVSLDSMPRITTHRTAVQLPGVRGWAVELAHFEPRHAPLFALLLDGVLVVEDAEAASRAVRALGGVRCVTLEGEVATGVGILRGGSRRSDEGGRIGKTRRIEELGEEIAELVRSADAVAAEIAAATAAIDAIDLKALADEVKTVEREMNGVEMRIAQLAFEKKRAADEIAKNRDEAERIGGERSALVDEEDAALPLFDGLKTEKAEVERSAAAAAAELELLLAEWNDRSAEAASLRLRRVTTGADLNAARLEFERAGEAIDAIGATLEKRDREIAAAREEIAAARASVDEQASALDLLRAELGSLDERRTAAEAEAARVRDEIHSIELRLKDERRRHDESMKTGHDLDLRIAELKARMAHLVARAAEEFEFTLERKTYADDEFVDFAAMREEVQALKDRLKNLGNVNFAAFEEYAGEKDRLEFLTTQRNDLLEAEKTLLSTIEEINQTAQRKFLETFEKIRGNFVDIFKSLFDPGDECDLRLEEEVDPLEAAIDIIAKPRGKRPTSIHLLSGGEKTLTAIALLFAIYLVKPSPFCILDEVDAPLDDANIDRFTRILRKFSNNTQFIVVTHNKRTMEAANALYGVTMEEEGVSKIVQVRFQQGAAVASAQLAAG